MDAPLARSALRLLPMGTADVDEVVAVEVSAYAFPWSRGNFIDSIAAGYSAELLRDPAGALVGYFVAMAGVQECHLLNITVAPALQGQGHGTHLLRHLAARRRALGDEQIWLEVRDSNHGAQALYRRFGFRAVGRRRGYYPAPRGTREDAIVMSLDLHRHDAAA